MKRILLTMAIVLAYGAIERPQLFNNFWARVWVCLHWPPVGNELF
jgi:hypothetical protein